MKVLSLFVFAWSILSAQTAPAPDLPDLPDKTVIAVFDDGVPFTMGDFKKLYAVLPPTNQQGALRDRKGFLEQYALMRKLVQIAEKVGRLRIAVGVRKQDVVVTMIDICGNLSMHSHQGPKHRV